jgi:hypothetical protein
MPALGTDLDARPEAPFIVPHEPGTTRAEPSWFLRHWPLLALTAGAIVMALVSRHVIYPAFSWNRDEATYLWQADALRGGHLFTTDGGAPSFFWPWLAGLRAGGFFSQYTVGWPLVLVAVDAVFGSPELSLVLGTILAVLGTYVFTRQLTDDRQLALVSATLMLASPIVLIQSGVYLAYLFSLGLGLFFGAALLAGLRRESRVLLLTSGVLLGWVLLTRPFDAVLWGAPLFGYATVVSWHKWPPLRRAVLWSLIGFVPFVAFTLAYNRHISGSFTQFPITAKDPLDTFGFGPRRLMPIAEIFDYTVGRAFRSVAHNFRTLPPFLVGGWLGAALAIVGVWLRRRDRTTMALLGIALAFPAGYFFFWGNLLSSRAASLSGPVYYVPLYAPACVFVATALIAVWRRRRAAAVVLCVALAGATVLWSSSKIDANHKISAAQEPWKGATRSIQGDALVIVENSGPYLMHLNPYSANEADLSNRILFAVDRGAENLDLITAHPERTIYLERTTDPGFDDPVLYHDAPVPSVSLIPLQVLHGNTATLRLRITHRSDDPAVVAYIQVGDRIERRVLATNAKRGETFEAEWTVAPAGSVAVAAGAAPLVERLGEIRVGVGSGTTPDEALAGKQRVEQFSYRRDEQAARIDVLYPGRSFMAETRHRTLDITEVNRLPGLDVQITTNQ